MQEELERYILSHIDPEPPQLQRLYRQTCLGTTYPHMCSGHLQGRMLKMIARMISPRRILEIGAFTGYSALCLAEGMPADAELHTIEIDDEKEELLLGQFEASPYAGRIHLHIGDALKIIPSLEGEFDMVFIDGNKRNYADYYRLVLPRTKKGGFILADNTLWAGKVAGAGGDAQSRGILAFNDLVAADSSVEKVILPVRDGLTIIRKH